MTQPKHGSHRQTSHGGCCCDPEPLDGSGPILEPQDASAGLDGDQRADIVHGLLAVGMALANRRPRLDDNASEVLMTILSLVAAELGYQVEPDEDDEDDEPQIERFCEMD
jgi:hypothetical protein